MHRAVLHGEAQRQSPRKGHGIDRAKRLRPEWRVHVAVAETEGQGQRLAARSFDPAEMPRRSTGKAMLWRRRQVPTGAEPREDNRDAAANCSARRKRTPGAREENRSLVR